jgi:hypothetical protein
VLAAVSAKGGLGKHQVDDPRVAFGVRDGPQYRSVITERGEVSFDHFRQTLVVDCEPVLLAEDPRLAVGDDAVELRALQQPFLLVGVEEHGLEVDEEI